MKNGGIRPISRETLLAGMISLLLMAGLLVLLIFTGRLFTVNADERIVMAARDSLSFKNHLKSDDIQVLSLDGAVTLTGTVAEEPHAALAVETVANLPGVKRVDNRLEIRAHVGSGPESLPPGLSGRGRQNATK